MRTLIFALALLSVPAFAQTAPQPERAPGACKAQPIPAGDPQSPRPRPLAEMPRGELYFTVLRIEDGCIDPMKVSDYRRRQQQR